MPCSISFPILCRENSSNALDSSSVSDIRENNISYAITSFRHFFNSLDTIMLIFFLSVCIFTLQHTMKERMFFLLSSTEKASRFPSLYFTEN